MDKAPVHARSSSRGVIPVENPTRVLPDASEVDTAITEVSGILLTFLKHDLPKNYRPVRDRVLVYPFQDKLTSQSASGLYVVQESAPDHAIVVSVGLGPLTTTGDRLPMEGLEEGQVIIYSKHSGTSVRMGGKTYLLLRVADILAIREGYDAASSGQ